ncbi:MAG: DUF3562 domain-containing protein [Candidatus Brocadiaceae bacterium]|uniref:DUF3562 domain-containing protein n=1 Tax=Candidatus Wunengus sp. YC61 TaxID=3367698 RepID=UPI0027232715|nr:DUF3562 domain-containing protein [Candidatus Brocadiaceae bacterium]
MNSTLLYKNEAEEKLHRNSIQTLARETRMPAEVVSSLYESVFDRLKNHARIKDFLPILVSREVKDILLHKINLSLTEYRDDYL